MISGSLLPVVQNNWTPCAGGTITVNYSGEDVCGNQLSSGSFTIEVQPAPPAILTTPVFPATLTCVMAEAFVADDATYDNGLMGNCENSGSIAASVQNNFDACGGQIIISYSGLDDCGNTLTAGPFTIDVDPAPIPTIFIPAYASPISCMDAETYVPPIAVYNNGLTGICEISGTIQAGVDNTWDACGGTLVLHYFTTDQCGNFISLPPIVINVQAAPLPTIALPVLPTSLSCEDATSYVPPSAAFTNGLNGACNLSGTASATLNHFYDKCGGILEVIYLGEDACGRNLVKTVGIINVDPAPAPTIDIPNFPTSLSCSAAQSFEAPITTYDNGLTGDCNISGFIEPTIVYSVEACEGGTMTITYNGVDVCGNTITAAPIFVEVEPAPLPTLEAPENVPSDILCWQAEGYYPGNATYSNGETGFCEKSGEIEGTISEFWNYCDGGYIVYSYSGVDGDGNELVPIVFKVAVLPDSCAPDGACAPIEETIALIDDVPEPDELQYYFDQIAAGYFEDCGNAIVSVTNDTGSPQCNEEGYFERVYTVEVTDKCGNIAGECSITFSGNCNQYLCTMTQKFYGDPTDDLFGVSSAEIVNTLIVGGNDPIIVGNGDCGMTLDNAQCIQTMLNTYGASISLPSGFVGTCDGTNNALVNQIITTTLNIRYNATMNSNGHIDLGGVLLSQACMNIPGFILNDLPDHPTVNDLLKYANDFIACQCTSTCGEFQPNMAELTNLFWGLNSRYNRCHVPNPCPFDFSGIPNNGQNATLDNNTIQLYPNPTNDLINLKLVNGYGRSCFIEIFDARGQKVGETSYTKLDQDILQLDVQEYKNGIYWITIKLDGLEQMTKRFMVIK